jgi:hypothetical protein
MHPLLTVIARATAKRDLPNAALPSLTQCGLAGSPSSHALIDQFREEARIDDKAASLEKLRRQQAAFAKYA